MKKLSDVIQIPLLCPKCEGKMIAVRYHEHLKILKQRSWQICKQCGYQIEADEFKKKLLTV